MLPSGGYCTIRPDPGNPTFDACSGLGAWAHHLVLPWITFAIFFAALYVRVLRVSLLETLGSIDWLGEQVATIGSALFAALLICYVGGAVSAFASTTGILGALIPLAVPFLETGAIGAVGLIIALSISSSVVDSSPFSTSGALVVANSPAEKRDFVFRRLMQWGMSMVVIAPLLAWLIFVVPGWL